jgi:hypothetical protein
MNDDKPAAWSRACPSGACCNAPGGSRLFGLGTASGSPSTRVSAPSAPSARSTDLPLPVRNECGDGSRMRRPVSALPEMCLRQGRECDPCQIQRTSRESATRSLSPLSTRSSSVRRSTEWATVRLLLPSTLTYSSLWKRRRSPESEDHVPFAFAGRVAGSDMKPRPSRLPPSGRGSGVLEVRMVCWNCDLAVAFGFAGMSPAARRYHCLRCRRGWRCR